LTATAKAGGILKSQLPPVAADVRRRTPLGADIERNAGGTATALRRLIPISELRYRGFGNLRYAAFDHLRRSICKIS